jgi:hypothetical protein
MPRRGAAIACDLGGCQLQEAIQPGSTFLIEGLHPTREIEAFMSSSIHAS